LGMEDALEEAEALVHQSVHAIKVREPKQRVCPRQVELDFATVEKSEEELEVLEGLVATNTDVARAVGARGQVLLPPSARQERREVRRRGHQYNSVCMQGRLLLTTALEVKDDIRDGLVVVQGSKIKREAGFASLALCVTVLHLRHCADGWMGRGSGRPEGWQSD
jgi:hypothetical protein